MSKNMIAGLAVDSWCQVAILKLHEALLDIIAENKLDYASTFFDSKAIPEGVDIAINNEGVRIEHEKELSNEIRDGSKIVVTIGSCARFGGVPTLARVGYGELLRVSSEQAGLLQDRRGGRLAPRVGDGKSLQRPEGAVGQVRGAPPDPGLLPHLWQGSRGYVAPRQNIDPLLSLHQ